MSTKCNRMRMNVVVFQVDIYLNGAETTDDTELPAVHVPPVSFIIDISLVYLLVQISYMIVDSSVSGDIHEVR